MSLVFNGQLAPHVTAEVDCESLFSKAGYLNDPRRSLTNVRMYERLVVSKHRLSRIYCPVDKVSRLFMKRSRDNSWKENDERDDNTFLEIEKNIYKSMNPHSAEFLEDGENSEEEFNDNIEENGDKEGDGGVDKEIENETNENEENIVGESIADEVQNVEATADLEHIDDGETAVA